MSEPSFDFFAAHCYFSADCFNRAWDEMDKAARTPEEDEQMILLGHTSYWHWTQRPDCTPTIRSVSCWQLSRIYALLGHANLSLHWADRSLEHSQAEEVEPFYRAYAFEALARAEKISGDSAQSQIYLQQAQEWTKKVEDEESRNLLLADLANLL